MLREYLRGSARVIRHYIILLISISGYVPKNASIIRLIVMLFSMFLALYVGIVHPCNRAFAIVYFLLSEIFYIGFLFIVLSKNGLRHWFIRYFEDEEEGYLAYEAILGILFFHNGISLGYISSSTAGDLFLFINRDLFLSIILVCFIGGFAIKLMAASAVTIEIYYLKDMFLGRKISDFVVSGPYKYLSNPMYGVGQFQAYAYALWNASSYGLTASFLNQFFLFVFYYSVEKKFIKRTYIAANSN